MKIRDVSVLVLHNGPLILLQKRAKNAKRFPGKWGLFGGGIEEGECPVTCLKREIDEELGFHIEKCTAILIQPYILSVTNEKGSIHVFEQKYDGQEIRLNEGDAMKWVTIRQALSMDLSPDFRKIIEKIGHRPHFMVL